MRQDLHEDEMFEGFSELLSPFFSEVALCDGACNTDIKQVELSRFCNHLPFLPFFIWLDQGTEQSVNENLIVLLDRLSIYSAIPRDVCIIRQFAVGVPHRIKEQRKRRNVPGQAFVEYLLFEIVPDISLERFIVFRLEIVIGDHARVK